MNQLDSILRRNWDILVILDACRYDYFARVASEYFPGRRVRKVISPASNTYEWAKKVLEPYDWGDVVYISANPWINSKTSIRDLDLRTNFASIYDAWLYDWDTEKNTVWPDKLTDRALWFMRQHEDKKFIIHYIQPHAPYLSLNLEQSSPFPLTGGNLGQEKTALQRIEDKLIYEYLPRPLFRTFLRWRMKKGLRIGGPEFVAFASLSLEEWRKAYVENLKMALNAVRKLLRHLEHKRVVITADHGELLGDRLFFGHKVGHPAFVHYLELVEVPWLEVKT